MSRRAERLYLALVVLLATALALALTLPDFARFGAPERLSTVPPGKVAPIHGTLEEGYYYWIEVTPGGDLEWWRRKAVTP